MLFRDLMVHVAVCEKVNPVIVRILFAKHLWPVVLLLIKELMKSEVWQLFKS